MLHSQTEEHGFNVYSEKAMLYKWELLISTSSEVTLLTLPLENCLSKLAYVRISTGLGYTDSVLVNLICQIIINNTYHKSYILAAWLHSFSALRIAI